jgi:hypothetical protein
VRCEIYVRNIAATPRRKLAIFLGVGRKLGRRVRRY